jgi:hypothetical protein
MDYDNSEVMPDIDLGGLTHKIERTDENDK